LCESIEGPEAYDLSRSGLCQQVGRVRALLVRGEFELIQEEPLLKELRACVSDVKEDTTPGIPLAHYAPKKGDWLVDEKKFLVLVLSRLEAMLELDLGDVEKMTAEELVSAGLRDPIYTFIKNEPHKRDKLDKKRFRLISSVSLVDNVVERFLFRYQNQKEILICDHTCFKPGMGLHDAGLQRLFSWFTTVKKSFAEKGHKPCSTDVTAWDWTVPAWLLKLERDYRLATGPRAGGWAHLVSVHSKCSRLKVFQLPTGEMFAQVVEGIQTSGCYCTSSGNSHMRCGLSCVVQQRLGEFDETCEEEGAQMGDDALERLLDGMAENYTALGFIVKGVQEWPEDHYSFCSTEWKGDWIGVPESYPKTLFRFLSKNPDDPEQPTLREQLRRDLRNLPTRDSIMSRVDEYTQLVLGTNLSRPNLVADVVVSAE
jgi:hypothetical protein